MTTELQSLRQENATLREECERLRKMVELLNKEVRVLLTARSPNAKGGNDDDDRTK